MKTVFFYGLFMDQSLLKNKGLHPSDPKFGYVDGYALKIGERATLIKSTNERAYGAVISLSEQELDDLYGESSIADYLPEEILVTTFHNGSLEAIVYNLPFEKLSGQNKQYAQTLARIASNCGLPKEYIQKIRAFSE